MADLYVPSQDPKAIVEVVGRGLVHNDGTPCSDVEIQATLYPHEVEEQVPVQTSPVVAASTGPAMPNGNEEDDD